MKWKASELTNKGTINSGKARYTVTTNDNGFKRDIIATTPYAKKFPQEFHRANADFIAASPEMYKAMKELRQSMSSIPKEYKEAWTKFINVLNKVEENLIWRK